MVNLWVIISAGLALGLCGCGPSPTAICASPELHAEILSDIYKNARDSLPGVVERSGLDQRRITNEIRNLQDSRLLYFDTVVLGGYDKTTKKVSCDATIVYAVPAQDKSEAAREGFSHIEGMEAPLRLLDGSAKSTITFTSQPSAVGNGRIIGAPDVLEPTSAIMMMAVNRVNLNQTHKPDNTK